MSVYPVSQQRNGTAKAPGSIPVNGVTIRYLTNDLEDAKFAGAMAVEAYKGKVVHHVTEGSVPTVINLKATSHTNQDESFYKRTLVAEYENKRVGVCQIKFKGDEDGKVENSCTELGCWKTFRLFYVGSVEENVNDDKHCYLDHIGVDVSLRGKGVGKLLLDRAEWEARTRGCSVIYLYVTTDNRSRSLYERQGYVVTDIMSCCGCLWCCIGPPGVGALIFRLAGLGESWGSFNLTSYEYYYQCV